MMTVTNRAFIFFSRTHLNSRHWTSLLLLHCFELLPVVIATYL